MQGMLFCMAPFKNQVCLSVKREDKGSCITYKQVYWGKGFSHNSHLTCCFSIHREAYYCICCYLAWGKQSGSLYLECTMTSSREKLSFECAESITCFFKKMRKKTHKFTPCCLRCGGIFTRARKRGGRERDYVQTFPPLLAISFPLSLEIMSDKPFACTVEWLHV